MTCPHPEKHRHATEGGALKHLQKMDRTKGVDLGLRPYPCGDHWHLGHKGDGKAARIGPVNEKALVRALRSGAKATKASRKRRKR